MLLWGVAAWIIGAVIAGMIMASVYVLSYARTTTREAVRTAVEALLSEWEAGEAERQELHPAHVRIDEWVTAEAQGIQYVVVAEYVRYDKAEAERVAKRLRIAE